MCSIFNEVYLRDREDDDWLVTPKKKLKPTLVFSPTKLKGVPLNTSADEGEENDNLNSLLSWTSFKSPIDDSWWSYIRNVPTLKPNLHTKDPHRIKISFRVPSITANELALFPEAFAAGIQCPANKWLLVCICSLLIKLLID